MYEVMELGMGRGGAVYRVA